MRLHDVARRALPGPTMDEAASFLIVVKSALYSVDADEKPGHSDVGELRLPPSGIFGQEKAQREERQRETGVRARNR